MFDWLKRASYAWFGLSGALLTVLGQLANACVLSPGLSQFVMWWPEVLRTAWRPPLELVGIEPHPHVAAVLSFALFLIMIGIGARLDARSGPQPLPPLMQARLLDDMTWPSLIVFAWLLVVFLSGLGHDPADDTPLRLFGSALAGRLSFALIAMFGYATADWFGHHLFHDRLYLLAGTVAIIWGVDAVKWWAVG